MQTATKFFHPDWCRHLHLELSTLCNAACPQCPRFHANSPVVRTNFQQTSVSLEDFQKWFPAEVIGSMEEIMLCGTHGDPVMAPDILEICRYVIDVNPEISIIVHTNGGMRTPKFWQEFAELLTLAARSRVVFGIDGLELTNHRYRRRVVWSKLISNVKAYLAAGGRAHWVYTLFQHNLADLDRARELSQTLGIEHFMTRQSWGVGSESEPVSMPVLDSEGSVIEWLDRPELVREPLRLTPRFQPKTLIPILAERAQGSAARVSCKAQTGSELRQIYVSAEGLVMPCCYWGTDLGSESHSERIRDTRARYWPHRQRLDLNKVGLRDILQSGVLDEITHDLWHRDCARACREVCGV